MNPLRPVLLERRVLPKVWGGRALDGLLGTTLAPPDQPIGETWEVFDRPDGSSPIRGIAGAEGEPETLRALMELDPCGLLGLGIDPTPEGYFPLLIKLIDARERLSIQVHPAAAQAARHGDGPKSEAWVVLAAGPDARIVRGFAPGVTAAEVAAAAREGEALEGLVHAFRPQVGDVIPVPPGVVHAIGPDVVVFEVQQNSDLTFRLWDWGRPRELHLEQALEALRVGDEGEAVARPRRIDAQAELLLDTPEFRIRRLRIDAPATLGTEGRYKLLTVLSGMAAVGWRSGGEHPPLPVRRGETVLVPAATDAVFVSPIGGLELLWTDAGEGS
jgi:mannose-6-phosphate isomerase